MDAVLKAKTFGLSRSIELSSGQEAPPIVCFRCGECCAKYQVRLSLMEARCIADDLALSWDVFLEKYVDQRWHGPESFLLRQCDGGRVFLEHSEGSNKTTCLIHRVKPAPCREWTPSLYRPVCRDGLAKYWKLTVSSSGQLEGTEERLRDFHSFIESLMIA
jgi:Fe-S-cluster containining protein